ncbi:anhydro-N-acetylmuramic acid kinase [Pseudohaliea rubra]|uniref:Anhydro-N-acetylmuramic acid kinase n=1 Tax=Pseudohaliea rubra DSM 19751 TaxID=1265313 RepID=A0A095XXT9_9GAMM|nr:anhydro-N-acetylmuramic acid kinase [Pseudohaliea rubra]KGE04556.1 Anhydro-N-acetylmuramic acid kinase [Pseudohaliea rubra DSM 19751]
MAPAYYLGLMSGTSIDGVDAALLAFHGDRFEVLDTLGRAHPPALREALATLCTPGNDGLDAVGPVDRAVALAFAEAALALLERHRIAPAQVAAIGSHGQTVRHRPGGEAPFTLQLGDPNLIAERTAITTVADFRRRDMAAGGEGAPLAPAFHRAAFAAPERRRAIVNIGGIANATLLDGATLVAGFDTGPGNTLLDSWARRHRGAAYDAGGAWGAEGSVLPALLEGALADPFFQRDGPRSTGREYFSETWLDSLLVGVPGADPRDVQATLAALTATGITRGLARAGFQAEEVYVCGGGAHNDDLMRRLHRALAPASLATTQALGLDPDWVEAAAFAWLARETLAGRPGNAPVVTGAVGPRVLGGIYPAGTGGRWTASDGE